MSKVIKDGAVIEDNWSLIEEAGLCPPGMIMVPLSTWNEQQIQISKRNDIGIWMETNQLPEEIEGDVSGIPIIAVRFRSFADGRGFSIGRLLRERYGFSGELRAIDAPIRDQLTYLARSGFNAFELADHYDPEEAISSLKDFSESYQSSVEEKEPLFKRRAD